MTTPRADDPAPLPPGRATPAVRQESVSTLLERVLADQRQRFQGGEPVAVETYLQQHPALATSPDGARLASALWDQTVKVWDARTGAGSHTLRGHAQEVTAAAFSADGSLLFTRDAGDKALAWDLPSGRPLDTPVPDPFPDQKEDPLGRYAVRPEGDTVRLIFRQPPKPDRDFWEEMEERRRILAPAWHAEDAERAEKAGDWFAADWHLARLLRLQAWNATLHLRRARSLAALKQPERAALHAAQALLLNPHAHLPEP